MAVSQGSATVGLYWDCRQRWDGTHDRPAAVFASPHFLEGQTNHLLGLFLPAVPGWVKPNEREAGAAPYPAAANVPLRLEAWLAAIAPATQSLACVARWFDTFGVPEPAPLPRTNYLREIEFSMRAFLESLWDASTQKWWTSKGGPKELSYLAWPAAYAYQLRLAARLTSDPALRDQYNARAALGEQLGGMRPTWDDLGLTWGNHYLDEAVRWARTGLPFVYVWNPEGQPVLRHASIAIFGGSWFEGSWIGQPVQWNGLRYAYALLKLAESDASFDWRKLAEGLTASALYQQDATGTNVALWPDNFSATDWSKCPWVFEPGMILQNGFTLIDHDVEPATAGDPYLHQTRLRVDGNTCRRLVIRARATSGNGLAIFWITAEDRQWAENKSIHLPFTNRGQLTEYVFDVGPHARWAGHTIVGLRVDPLEGSSGGDFAIDDIRGDHGGRQLVERP